MSAPPGSDRPSQGQPPGWGTLGDVKTPARDRRPPLLAALFAVALVVGIGLIAAAMLLTDQPPAATPTAIAASPSPAPPPTPTTPGPPTPALTPTVPPATPAVGRTPPPDIDAQIQAVVEQVPPIRGLQPLMEVPYVLLTRDEFAAELEQMLDEEIDPEVLAAEERLLKRFGLLPEEANLRELYAELYGSQIAAYYRPDTGTFYVIERDEPFGPMDRMIVAHEYTHALQDQHFGLEANRITDPAEGDAALAQLAAVEGDATLLMYVWAFQSLTPREQLELTEGASPTEEDVMERMPLVLRRQLMFPYLEGMIFASAVNRLGDWEAVNETLTRPPASTEQVIHPEKYFLDEQPVAVNLLDLQAVLGPGWDDVYQQTLGELFLQIWLADGEEPPLPFEPGPTPAWQDAAAGWGGDRLHMYESDAGEWAVVAQVAWDTSADAEEFEAHARPLLPTLDGVADLRRLDDQTALLIFASDESTLGRLTAAFAE